jgi:tripartite-type tricarboxylate transporter receptor subunit TctC
MQRRQLITAAALAPGLSLLPAAAQVPAPALPGTVKYVVPFAAGGLTDVMARMAARQLADGLGITVVVENKAGGNAQIGADQVAKGPADGSQILAITLAHAANVSLFPNAPYNFARDLRPVALLAGVPMLVVVPADSPIKTLADLVSASRSRVLNAGSSGNGTPPHLTMALFGEMNKVGMTHVPYRGGAPSMVDLIGGRLDVIFSNFPESIAHVNSGKLRALALCSAQRHPHLPNVPTTAEAGMPKLLVENWTAAMVQAKTPDAVVDRYSRELIKLMFTPEIEERARAMGFLPKPMGRDAFGSFLTSEIDRWSQLIRAAKISVT